MEKDQVETNVPGIGTKGQTHPSYAELSVLDLCPQSDSNRHLADFKSAASANWAIGAPQASVVSPPALPEIR